MTIVWHDGSEAHSESFKDEHEMKKRRAELANEGFATLILGDEIARSLEIDVNSKQLQTILDALMDNFGVLALPEEVVGNLAAWALRYQVTALAMGSTAELEALARRLTAREEV